MVKLTIIVVFVTLLVAPSLGGLTDAADNENSATGTPLEKPDGTGAAQNPPEKSNSPQASATELEASQSNPPKSQLEAQQKIVNGVPVPKKKKPRNPKVLIQEPVFKNWKRAEVSPQGQQSLLEPLNAASIPYGNPEPRTHQHGSSSSKKSSKKKKLRDFEKVPLERTKLLVKHFARKIKLRANIIVETEQERVEFEKAPVEPVAVVLYNEADHEIRLIKVIINNEIVCHVKIAVRVIDGQFRLAESSLMTVLSNMDEGDAITRQEFAT